MFVRGFWEFPYSIYSEMTILYKYIHISDDTQFPVHEIELWNRFKHRFWGDALHTYTYVSNVV